MIVEFAKTLILCCCIQVEIPNLNAQPLPAMRALPTFDRSFFSQAAKLPAANSAISNNNHLGFGSASAPSSSAPLISTAGLSQSSLTASTSNPAASALLPSKNTSSLLSLSVPLAASNEAPSSESAQSAAAATSSALPTAAVSASSLSVINTNSHPSHDSGAEFSFTFATPTPVEVKLNGGTPNGTTTTAVRATGGDEVSFEFSAPIPL